MVPRTANSPTTPYVDNSNYPKQPGAVPSFDLLPPQVPGWVGRVAIPAHP